MLRDVFYGKQTLTKSDRDFGATDGRDSLDLRFADLREAWDPCDAASSPAIVPASRERSVGQEPAPTARTDSKIPGRVPAASERS